jgi:hypothetical protein
MRNGLPASSLRHARPPLLSDLADEGPMSIEVDLRPKKYGLRVIVQHDVLYDDPVLTSHRGGTRDAHSENFDSSICFETKPAPVLNAFAVEIVSRVGLIPPYRHTLRNLFEGKRETVERKRTEVSQPVRVSSGMPPRSGRDSRGAQRRSPLA